MHHSFDVDIAVEFGLKDSILLQHLIFWLQKNKANNKNYYDEHYWTYSSMKAFSELFPYFSEKEIRGIIGRLKKKNVLLIGNYNETKYDRTQWYAISDDWKHLLEIPKSTKRNNAFDKKANGLDQKESSIRQKGKWIRQKGEPIPDLSTYSKTNTKESSSQLVEGKNILTDDDESRGRIDLKKTYSLFVKEGLSPLKAKKFSAFSFDFVNKKIKEIKKHKPQNKIAYMISVFENEGISFEYKNYLSEIELTKSKRETIKSEFEKKQEFSIKSQLLLDNISSAELQEFENYLKRNYIGIYSLYKDHGIRYAMVEQKAKEFLAKKHLDREEAV